MLNTYLLFVSTCLLPKEVCSRKLRRGMSSKSKMDMASKNESSSSKRRSYLHYFSDPLVDGWTQKGTSGYRVGYYRGNLGRPPTRSKQASPRLHFSAPRHLVSIHSVALSTRKAALSSLSSLNEPEKCREGYQLKQRLFV